MAQELSEADVALGMLMEAKNKLTQCKVIDRMMVRKKLSNKLTTQDMNIDGQNRSTMSAMKQAIEDLTSIHTAILEEDDKKK